MGGGRMMGGPGGRRNMEANLDPFAGEKDPNKALLHRLLAVPALRARYAGYIKEMAAVWLDWARLEPIAKEHQALIAADVAADTKKHAPTGEFTRSLATDLKGYVDKRRAFLAGHAELNK
jgi:hypothetical protein